MNHMLSRVPSTLGPAPFSIPILSLFFILGMASRGRTHARRRIKVLIYTAAAAAANQGSLTRTVADPSVDYLRARARGSYVNMETGSWNPVLDSTYDSNQRAVRLLHRSPRACSFFLSVSFSLSLSLAVSVSLSFASAKEPRAASSFPPREIAHDLSLDLFLSLVSCLCYEYTCFGLSWIWYIGWFFKCVLRSCSLFFLYFATRNNIL